MSDTGEKSLGDIVALHAITLCGVVILWLTPLAYPLRLFATFLHELGHLFAAGLSGGRVREIKVHSHGGGHVWREGGIDWLVNPAGYVATAVAGTLLLQGIAGPARQRTSLGIVTLLLLGFLGTAAGSIAVLVSLGLLLAWLLIMLIRDWEVLRGATVRVLALAVSIHAIMDLLALLTDFGEQRTSSIWTVPVGRPDPDGFYTDATLMAWRFGGSEGAWALAWLAVSLVVLLAGIHFGVRAELRESRVAAGRLSERLRSFRKGEGEHTVR